MEPIESGCEWEDDPVGNANSHDGRTIRRDMRAKAQPTRLAIVKRPKPELVAEEIYSIGMERIGYALGHLLELPVLETYLEVVDGHESSLQRRLPDGVSWRQLSCFPLMLDNIANVDVYAKAALFDVWLGNTDRTDINLLFDPEPQGAKRASATACRMWLIDHGCCGLWPPKKLDLNADPHDIPTDPEAITGQLAPEVEQHLAVVMPPKYRMALKHTTGPGRKLLLDAVREVGDDDAIDTIVAEVPTSYITGNQGATTAAFLKARRDLLDDVLDQYWQP